MKIKQILVGVATLIPGVNRLVGRGTGGSGNARYCYSVWMRHLVNAVKNGMKEVPEVVAELGPGDSLGVGIAALLSGSKKYFAFDVVRYADKKKNALILGELTELFRSKEPVPGDDEFPRVRPKLDDYSFPSEIISNEAINRMTSTKRLESIRKSIDGSGELINYFVPWDDSRIIKEESVDMVVTQAVLEHIDDTEGTVNNIKKWLKPGGVMSHVIDFSSHGMSGYWNGHWGFSDFLWKIIRGKRRWSINRKTHGEYIKIMEKSGFKIAADIKFKGENGIKRKKMDKRFVNMSEEDFETRAAYILGFSGVKS